MRINGIDIAIYGAKQHTVEMGFADIGNKSEWVEGNSMPLMLAGTIGFKTIKVTVILEGNSREEIWQRGNCLISSLLKPSVVTLDGFTHNFYVYLKNAVQAEEALQRWHKATLQLVGYEYADQTVVTVSGTVFRINNPGTLETPAVLELTPAIGKVSMAISGFTRDSISGKAKPMIIRGLTMNKTIVIDGETGLITENGENKFKDVELYDLPSLLPGINEIITDQSDVLMVVKYKPRYL